MCEHRLKRGLAHYMAVATLVGYTVGTQLYLLHALLARHIKHPARGHTQDCLQHECRLSDARLTAQQHKRARYKTTAQHAVQFGIAQVNTWQGVGGHIIYEHRLRQQTVGLL